MIRRPAGDDFLLIAQHDHALIAGALAAHIGGKEFERPHPREAVIAAIHQHDGGWPGHDEQPTLNAKGQPLHVFETPLGIAMNMWSESVRHAAALGPYAQMLVSLHTVALSNIAVTHALPSRENADTARDLFELNKFQHRQLELQEGLRRELNLRTDIATRLGLGEIGTDAAEDALRRNYRFLAAMDCISLQLCCGQPGLFTRVEEVYPHAGGAAVSLALREAEDGALTIWPWPFDTARIVLETPARRVPGGRFESEAAFRSAYAHATRETVRFILREP